VPRAIEPIAIGTRHGKLQALTGVFWLDGRLLVRCRCDCGTERDILYGNFKQGLSRSCGCKRAESRKHEIQCGTRYGNLILVEEVHAPGERRQFRCQCDCGEQTVVTLKALKNGNTRSCGCLRRLQHVRMPPPIGETFGFLEVLEESGDIGNDRGMRCRCRCGTIVIVRLSALRSENTRSCGCWQRKLASDLPRKYLSTHGLSKTRFYKRWMGIIQRCADPNYSSYPNYGAKGIRVCDRWRKFENFAEDMLQAFNDHVAEHGVKNTTIDRINSRGNYEPSNCRWATYKVQLRNRSCTRLIEWKGESHTLMEWAEITGISFDVLAARFRKGWDAERALTEPLNATGPNARSHRRAKDNRTLVG
jgi:hypothetical protein